MFQVVKQNGIYSRFKLFVSSFSYLRNENNNETTENTTNTENEQKTNTENEQKADEQTNVENANSETTE